MSRTRFTLEERAQFDQAAVEAEAGYSIELLRTRRLGRPLQIGQEAGQVIPIRLDPARLAGLDLRAKTTGRSRSQVLRDALDKELAAA